MTERTLAKWAQQVALTISVEHPFFNMSDKPTVVGAKTSACSQFNLHN